VDAHLLLRRGGVPENNLFLDDHLVYAVIFVGLAYAGAGRYLGLGKWWGKTELGQEVPDSAVASRTTKWADGP
jgi:hypothetical protein